MVTARRRCHSAFVAVLILACMPALALPPHSIGLDSGWRFRAVNGSGHAGVEQWHDAEVPGLVQTDLLRNKLIGDPFYRDNEKSLQWVGLTDWEYQTEFDVDAATLARAHVEILFAGLDTYADVYLNDAELLKADNMFRSWRLPVKDRLHAGKNTLRIVFHSPVALMMPKVKAEPYRLPTVGQVQAISEEGIATDPYTRKAPYNYGWDWGPRYITEGIWQPVKLIDLGRSADRRLPHKTAEDQPGRSRSIGGVRYHFRSQRRRDSGRFPFGRYQHWTLTGCRAEDPP
jgi:beta-mannosidase